MIKRRTMTLMVALIAVGMIVAAGFCVFDDDRVLSTQLDLCGSVLSVMTAPTLAFILGLTIATFAVAGGPPRFVTLDLLTPPPRVQHS